MSVASLVALQFIKASRAKKDTHFRAMLKWDDDMRQKSEDPTFVPPLAEVFVSDFEAQFMSEIVTGLDEYFMCRQKHCMFVCRNTDWIHNAAHNPPQKGDPVHYRCPKCGQQYRPWMQKPNYCKANKVYVLDQQSACYLDGTEILKGTVMVYPIEWPDTPTTNLVNEFKQISAGMDEEIKAMDPRVRARIIHHQVITRPMKTYMQNHQVGQDAIEVLKGLPFCATDRTWKYEHLNITGIQGWHAMDLAEATPLALKDVIRIWGFAKYMLHQVDAACSKRELTA